MDFGYVIKRAWQIIWKFKILWLFGILASCGQSGSSGSNLSYRFSSSDLPMRYQYFLNNPDPRTVALIVIFGIFMLLVIIVLAILLGTIGRVGLIRGTVRAEQGAGRLTFGELWRDGLVYFWRVFGLNLLVGILIFLVFIVLLIPGIILTVLTVGLFALCLIPLICLAVPVMWAVSVWLEQANIALVVENLGITDAIRRGWQVVKENVGNLIVMALILLVIGLIGGLIIGLPFLVVSAPMFLGYANGTAQAIRNGWIFSALFFLVYLPFLLIFSGILRSYTASAWTLTYLRLTNRPTAPAPLVETPGIPGDVVPPPA